MRPVHIGFIPGPQPSLTSIAPCRMGGSPFSRAAALLSVAWPNGWRVRLSPPGPDEPSSAGLEAFSTGRPNGSDPADLKNWSARWSP
jgi:hypothetical protein